MVTMSPSCSRDITAANRHHGREAHLARSDGPVRQGAATLGDQPDRAVEQGGPGRVGGSGDQDRTRRELAEVVRDCEPGNKAPWSSRGCQVDRGARDRKRPGPRRPLSLSAAPSDQGGGLAQAAS